jgi:hypothetical protein
MREAIRRLPNSIRVNTEAGGADRVRVFAKYHASCTLLGENFGYDPGGLAVGCP